MAASWYQRGRMASGLVGGMRAGAQERRFAAQERRNESQERRTQQTFERTESEAEEAEERRKSKEMRDQARFDMEQRRGKIDIRNAQLDQILKSGQVADDRQRRRLEMQIKQAQLEAKELDKRIRRFDAAGRGIDPGGDVTPGEAAEIAKYQRFLDRQIRAEGILDALPHALAHQYTAAEEAFNLKGNMRIRPNTLQETPDPNDPPWTFQYVNDDTGETVKFDLMAQANLAGGGIGQVNIGGQDTLQFFDKDRWPDYLKDQEAMARTEATWGRGRGRGKMGMSEAIKKLMADFPDLTEEQAMRLYAGKDRTTQVRQFTDLILKNTVPDWRQATPEQIEMAKDQATQYVDSLMFGDAGVSPPPPGGQGGPPATAGAQRDQGVGAGNWGGQQQSSMLSDAQMLEMFDQ